MTAAPEPVESHGDTGHSPGVLAKLLAQAIHEHVARTGETERQLAIRIGMKHQNLYELLRRADDPDFDVGRVRLERLASAIGYTWKLEPAAPEKDRS